MYINLISEGLGILSSENFLRSSILKNKNFHDQLGVFNQDYFKYFLNRNNISEIELLIINPLLKIWKIVLQIFIK